MTINIATALPTACIELDDNAGANAPQCDTCEDGYYVDESTYLCGKYLFISAFFVNGVLVSCSSRLYIGVCFLPITR